MEVDIARIQIYFFVISFIYLLEGKGIFILLFIASSELTLLHDEILD